MNIKLEDFGKAVEEELTLYSKSVNAAVNEAGRRHIKNLVTKTKATAPRRTGDFRKSIASKESDAGHGMKTFTWYVKAPDYRLTHLLVHGHVTRDGNRTKADPFLSDAWADVSESYMREIEEAVSHV